jgi:hypothetical protein
VAIWRGLSSACFAWEGEDPVGDVQYPTLWLPIGSIGAVVVAAVVLPGRRSIRIVISLALIALVIVGYAILPQILDVDRLIRR